MNFRLIIRIAKSLLLARWKQTLVAAIGVTFSITMFIAFGVAFEVPIVVVILARMGVVTVEQLRAWRSYFIVGAAAVAGLVTPPDPVSMIALLVPMVLLYEVGIWAASFFIKHTKSPAQDDPAAETPQ